MSSTLLLVEEGAGYTILPYAPVHALVEARQNPGLGVRSTNHPNVASGDFVTTAHDVDGPDTRAHGADRGTGHRFHASLETRAEDLSRRPTATWTT